VPEFEVRLFWANEKTFQTIVIDAKSEKAALPKAAQLARQHGASFFEVRRPTAQRWVRRD
jgi:Mg-chelatase subunit ChlD